MDLKTAKTLSFDELRNVYRDYLRSKGLGKNTVQTAYSDTFYLWRKVSADEFWATISAKDFDTVARKALMIALKENTTGDPATLVTGYLSHLRRFREFLSGDDGFADPAEKKKEYLCSDGGRAGAAAGVSSWKGMSAAPRHPGGDPPFSLHRLKDRRSMRAEMAGPGYGKGHTLRGKNAVPDIYGEGTEREENADQHQ